MDGSHYSENILNKAIEHARMVGGEIFLVYCHRKYPRLLKQPYRDQLISAINDETAEVVGPYVDMLKKSEVPFIERFLETPASIAIVETAEAEKCDLIVMGSRGLTNLQGLILGSTVHRVLHLAKCPVLVVP